MPTILITGGTGLIGQSLGQALLGKGYQVIILSRGKRQGSGHSKLAYAHWDPSRGEIDRSAIEQADYIINLAGTPLAGKRWTKKRKQEILESRVESGRTLIKALQEIPNKVSTVINASAIGWYGPDSKISGPKPFEEADPPATDFLGSVCRRWEDSVEGVKALNKRLVILRIGIVLSREGGAFKEFVKPLRFGLAGVPGNGRQIMSWIHISDLVNLFIRVLEDPAFRGIYNAVAPEPVPAARMIRQLRKSYGRFSIPIKAPAFLLRLMIGEMSIEVLKSCTVSCHRAMNLGFRFEFKDIELAVDDLLRKRKE